MVADQVLAIGSDHHLPFQHLCWLKALRGLVKLMDQPTKPSQLLGRERRESVGHLSRDVLQHVAAELVATQRPGRTQEADLGEVIQQRLDSRGGDTSRLAYGRADPDNHISDIPALKDMLRGRVMGLIVARTHHKHS